MSDAPHHQDSYLQELSAILNNARNGDSIAEATVHREFVDKLVRVASRRINSRFQAKVAPEEVVQSVFASFFRRHRDQEYHFDSWNDLWAFLLRITICKCADRIAEFQTLKRNILREVRPTNESDSDPKPYLKTGGPTAEEVVIFEDTLDQLLNKLDKRQQKVVCLRLQGMSNLEISQVIGRTERSVYRMLQKIKSVFEENYPDFGEE